MRTTDEPLAPLYVVTGDEPLLIIETLDHIRQRCKQSGFTEREVLILEARSDWSAIFAATQSRSLFGDKKYLEIKIPTGKPGRAGSDALVKLAQQLSSQPLSDTIIAFHLPKLDSTQSKSAWMTALKKIATLIDIPTVTRERLPTWLQQRAAQYQQKLDADALTWVAERVEGNLLAAHQEILKLSLLYPTGTLSLKQVQDAILPVARYDVFDLRDALLQQDFKRCIRMIDGLQAEGEALPLILWSISEDIRALYTLSLKQMNGQPIGGLLRQYRFWGAREQIAQQALRRIPHQKWKAALRTVHALDRLIKGIPLAHQVPNPWHELKQLCSILCVDL